MQNTRKNGAEVAHGYQTATADSWKDSETLVWEWAGIPLTDLSPTINKAVSVSKEEDSRIGYWRVRDKTSKFSFPIDQSVAWF